MLPDQAASNYPAVKRLEDNQVPFYYPQGHGTVV